MSGSAIVVGGGVIGAACAHYLHLAGWHVTLLERERFAGACSHANCGLVCPSHVLPLAAPGALGAALRAVLWPGGPLSIKPRFDPTLWAWFVQFARRCNRRDMLAAGVAIQALLNSSRRLYDELLAAERLDCEWEARGLLFAFADRRSFEHYAATADLLHTSFGVTVERFAGDALLELEPALVPGLAGGWLYPADAHLRPDRLMAAWRGRLEAHGVAIREHCRVSGLARAGGRVRAVVTSEGELPADAFVIATGAFAPEWQDQLGCRLPIQPGKGYSLTMPRPTVCPRHPLIFEQEHVAATPFATGFRLGSTMEFAGYDASLPPRRLELLLAAARRYLREPHPEPIEERWFGWRPMTSDGLPIIDRSPAADNVLLAAGHNMLGLSMAPATGRLAAELLSGQTPHIDPAPYAVDRWGTRRRARGAIAGVD